MCGNNDNTVLSQLTTRCQCRKCILPVAFFFAVFLLLAFWKTGLGRTGNYSFDSIYKTSGEAHLFDLNSAHSKVPSSNMTLSIITVAPNGTGSNVVHRRILFWTTFFGHADFYFGVGHEPFQRLGCKISDCEITTDRTLLNTSDAVVFHFRDVSIGDLPTWRHPHQRWIFFLSESPAYTSLEKLKQFNGKFNWTMSYRLDSDIVNPYGAIGPQNHSMGKLRSTGVTMQTQREANSKNVKKRRLVAWLVSNCHTSSQREKYVHKLSKHIPVDTYGACSEVAKQKSCLENPCGAAVYQRHKFYLSFENSVCRDYITEKFFKALRNNVVPIVYGGGDYAKIAPPHSYINVDDFVSPNHLADYLKALDANDSMYNEYLSWTKDWRLLDQWEGNFGFCQLCAALHQPHQTTVSKVYFDIADWWAGDGICRPSTEINNEI